MHGSTRNHLFALKVVVQVLNQSFLAIIEKKSVKLDRNSSYRIGLTQGANRFAEFSIRSMGIYFEKRARFWKCYRELISIISKQSATEEIPKFRIKTAVLPDHCLKCRRIYYKQGKNS